MNVVCDHGILHGMTNLVLCNRRRTQFRNALAVSRAAIWNIQHAGVDALRGSTMCGTAGPEPWYSGEKDHELRKPFLSWSNRRPEDVVYRGYFIGPIMEELLSGKRIMIAGPRRIGKSSLTYETLITDLGQLELFKIGARDTTAPTQIVVKSVTRHISKSTQSQLGRDALGARGFGVIRGLECRLSRTRCVRISSVNTCPGSFRIAASNDPRSSKIWTKSLKCPACRDAS